MPSEEAYTVGELIAELSKYDPSLPVFQIGDTAADVWVYDGRTYIEKLSRLGPAVIPMYTAMKHIEYIGGTSGEEMRYFSVTSTQKPEAILL